MKNFINQFITKKRTQKQLKVHHKAVIWNFILFNNLIIKDSAEYTQFDFQDASTTLCKNLITFHDNVMFIIFILLIIVGIFLYNAINNKNYHKFLTENVMIEFIWTCIPAIILIIIAVPSLKLLYNIDEYLDSALTIKVIGHQWYWSYEYPKWLNETSFDSYMKTTEDLEKGDFRLLEVDNRVIIPSNTPIKFLVTSQDVIHSFAVPSLGIKVDAIPGRLNQGFVNCSRIGLFYGQCSEICGSDHSFMPICIQSIPTKNFLKLFN